MNHMIHWIVFLNFFILIYYGLLSAWYTLTLLTAFPDMINTFREVELGNLDWLMQQSKVPITVIIPAFNERERVFNTIYSILQNEYKNTHIVLVNDGSTDNTMEILIEEFELYEVPPVILQKVPSSPIKHCYISEQYPQLMVIDKEHGPANNGADSNNTGLNAAATPLIMTVDADTIIEPDAISHLIYCYLSKRKCIAVGGTIYVLNENKVEHGKLLTRNFPHHFIEAIQGIEYYRSFSYGRAGLNTLSGALCFPGAFTLLEKKAASDFGGYDTHNFSYDAEITLKFHHYMRNRKYPTSVRFSSSPLAWTMVPSTLERFWEQRNRWQRGMLLSAWKHKRMFLNPKYGIVGLITFPSFIIFEIFSPVVEFMAYLLFIISLILKIVTWTDLFWFFALAWSFLTVISTVGFFLNMMTFKIYNKASDLVWIIVVIMLEMFGFRQYKALCCTYSTLQFLYNRLRGKYC